MNASPHPAALDAEQLKAECDVTRTRRSGPGGQNRNKVETAIVLRHRPTGIEAEASERRSQHENLQAALFRLRVNLALGVRQPTPAEVSPSPTWRAHLRGGRIEVSPRGDDFPTMLAEALDAIEAHGHDLRRAAEALGGSASQVTKLLKEEPRALALVNERRRGLGLRPLL
jgi:hypothetical protein